jgi:hypothetical protein
MNDQFEQDARFADTDRTVKYEEVYLKDYASPREARSGLSAYLDFYNYRRLHQALDCQTPASIYFKKGEQSTDKLPILLSCQDAVGEFVHQAAKAANRDLRV